MSDAADRPERDADDPRFLASPSTSIRQPSAFETDKVPGVSTIFEVKAISDRDGKALYYGARRTRSEAEVLMAERRARVEKAGGKVKDWSIEEIDVRGAFEIPSRPIPRDRFTHRAEPVQGRSGTWATCQVEVFDDGRLLTTFDRNYAMLDTFEPFRQGNRFYALVAPDYTATAVMDLATGEIVAKEDPSPSGFCPAGFYVPDWWDVNDGSILPGSHQWKDNYEWPTRGDFGFVWGCIWGDDSSWKVQYLDLSRISEGVVARSERFGYVELASEAGTHPKQFIRLHAWDGHRRVEFRVREEYDLNTGSRVDRNPFNDD